MDEPLTATGNDARIVLEYRQRLSHCMLWRLQRNFFDQRGVSAWSQGTVPHYIASNPFIANAYANVVLGFLRDCRAVGNVQESSGFLALDLSQPVYIIELGSGSGRFAFYFLKSLLDYYDRSILKGVLIKYVMTDFAERNVEFWSSHPALQPFVEQGVLDFACYDVERDEDIKLNSGDTLSAETVKNPLVVISNYFFDSIPQDVFYVEGGQLHERLVTLSSSEAETRDDDPELLNRIEISYETNPTSAEYYDDPEFNCILRDYEQRLASTTILFPCAALQCIRHLRQLSSGRMLLLSGDKGHIREESLLNYGEPDLKLHGSFSMMVNYHAIARYFQNQGGQALHTSHRHACLNICGFLLGNHSGGYVETQLAYDEAIENGGPDDFFTLNKGMKKHYEDLTLEELLALLRLSGWDAKIFLDSLQALLSQVESASESLRQELFQAIQHVWENYYHIGEERDIAFYMGMLLYGMQYYPEALDYFQHSLQLYGPDASTSYNMAMCSYSLRQLDAALENINQTLALDASFEPAKGMRLKIQSELVGRKG